MKYLSMQQADKQVIFNGFIEAMYFMDGADADFKDNEGFYMDGQFNSQYDLSDKSIINIKLLIEAIISKLPEQCFTLFPLARIGNYIYYEIQGQEGFPEDEVAPETREELYQLFFNSVFLEIFDNEDTKEIEVSYTENWN